MLRFRSYLQTMQTQSWGKADGHGCLREVWVRIEYLSDTRLEPRIAWTHMLLPVRDSTCECRCEFWSSTKVIIGLHLRCLTFLRNVVILSDVTGIPPAHDYVLALADAEQFDIV